MRQMQNDECRMMNSRGMRIMMNAECRMQNSTGRHLRRCVARAFLLNSAFTILHSAFALAQTASPYVPTTYCGTPYIEHFIASGKMVDPSPLTRPLRADQVVSALQAMDSTTVAGGQWRVVRAILNDLRRTEQGPYGRIDGDIGVAAATYAERDPLE